MRFIAFYILLAFTVCSIDSRAQDSIVIHGKFIENSKYAKVLMKKFAVGSFPFACQGVFTLTPIMK
jgi:hypothetical protein